MSYKGPRFLSVLLLFTVPPVYPFFPINLRHGWVCPPRMVRPPPSYLFPPIPSKTYQCLLWILAHSLLRYGREPLPFPPIGIFFFSFRSKSSVRTPLHICMTSALNFYSSAVFAFLTQLRSFLETFVIPLFRLSTLFSF